MNRGIAPPVQMKFSDKINANRMQTKMQKIVQTRKKNWCAIMHLPAGK